MDMLHVSGNQIVDNHDHPVQLRGTCVGGWMNMEEFINGYPGAEHQVRAELAKVLGEGKAKFFFDRMLDHFFSEEDVVYLKSIGSTVVRLPLNYRHFEADADPFHYLESGFQRLDQAIAWCAQHGLYVILDLHAVQGWQNTDWHSDNASRHTYFWQHPYFQERFKSLWQELALRYRGNHAVAGYNLMNEPVSNAPYGRFHNQYQPDWETVNRVYREAVDAVRTVDPDHIIFLEGDYFSSRFAGLEAPFADNLVYSSHNYTNFGFGPGKYPSETWNREVQLETFETREGSQFTRQHNVPLWVGEFGAAYNGPAEEIPDRLRAMDDQLDVFNQTGAHWTTWTYKDIHVMGLMQLDPESAYVRAIRPVLDAKTALATDFWMGWIAPTPAKQAVYALADQIAALLPPPGVDPQANHNYLGQHLLSGYTAALLQPAYAQCFAGLSEEKLDDILTSFALKNCRPHLALEEILRRRLAA
jgi:aryl-phospho-beta-D-glucosidase BglC (GH1 family)